MEQFESVKEMIENLRSEDPELRLSSMRGIHLIAATLGPERTRDELLLYLTDYLDDNDEVLRVFANAMGNMLQEVDGVAHVGSLLSPLEILASLDEITVREEAVESLKLLGDAIYKANSKESGVSKAQSAFQEMVERMAKGTPQSRSSAATLVATIYSRNASNATSKGKLMELFKGLCKDEEIMVRRAACVAIGKALGPTMGAKAGVELLPLLTSFSKDSSDGVRLQAVTTAAAMLKLLPETQHGAVLTCVKTLAGDSSWRVRYMAADRFGDLTSAMAPSDVAKTAVSLFQSLCQDAEPEIRAATVFNMASVLSLCRDATKKRDVLLSGTRLVSDESSHVRMSLASAVLKSVVHVPKELWGTTVIPACTALLKDTEPDVRLALVSGFSSMGNTAEAKELAPKLVPVVISLSGDPKWRLREVVVSQVPYVITSLGKNAEEEVVNVCVERLTDRVATIRDAAVQSCSKLVAENGAAWAAKSLFPRLNELAKDGNYLHRVTLCHLYAALGNVEGFDRPTCQTAVWPTLQRLKTDEVPNVRLNVAKAILALQRGGKLDRKLTDGLMADLKKDTCGDVRDAAAGNSTD